MDHWVVERLRFLYHLCRRILVDTFWSTIHSFCVCWNFSVKVSAPSSWFSARQESLQALEDWLPSRTWRQCRSCSGDSSTFKPGWCVETKTITTGGVMAWVGQVIYGDGHRTVPFQRSRCSCLFWTTGSDIFGTWMTFLHENESRFGAAVFFNKLTDVFPHTG